MTKNKGYEARTYRAIDFHEDPNAPKGMMYFQNDYYMRFKPLITSEDPKPERYTEDRGIDAEMEAK